MLVFQYLEGFRKVKLDKWVPYELNDSANANWQSFLHSTSRTRIIHFLTESCDEKCGFPTTITNGKQWLNKKKKSSNANFINRKSWSLCGRQQLVSFIIGFSETTNRKRYYHELRHSPETGIHLVLVNQ